MNVMHFIRGKMWQMSYLCCDRIHYNQTMDGYIILIWKR